MAYHWVPALAIGVSVRIPFRIWRFLRKFDGDRTLSIAIQRWSPDHAIGVHRLLALELDLGFYRMP
jgi:hypothetical protein